MAQRHFKQLIKDMMGYSLHTIVAPLFTIILTPIYTRVLEDASVYGIVDMLIMSGSIIFTLALINIHQAIMPLYHDQEDHQYQYQVISNAFIILFIWATLLVGTAIIFADSISNFLFDRDDLANLFRITVFSQWFAVFYTLCGSILRLRHQIKQANILALSYIFIFALSNIILVIWLRWGAKGIVTSQLITYSIVTLLGLFLVRYKPDLCLNKIIVKKIYKLALPLMPAAFASWLLFYEDRFFLTRLATYHDIGIYSIAIKLASMIGVLLMAFKMTWLPLALSIKNEPDAPNLYAKTLVYYAIGGFTVALSISLFSHEILLLFTTSEYIEAQRYIWLTAFMSISEGFQISVATGLYLKQDLSSQAWIVAVAALINTVLNIILIPLLGVLGAAIATAIAYMIVPILTAYKSQQIYPLPYDWTKIFLLGGAYFLISGTGTLIEPEVSVSSLMLRFGLLSLFIFLIWSNAITTSSERKMLYTFIRQPRRTLLLILRKA